LEQREPYTELNGRVRPETVVQESTYATKGAVAAAQVDQQSAENSISGSAHIMKNQKTLCWVIFVCHLIVSLILCFMSVGIGMAAGDCAQCTPTPRPQTLDSINNFIRPLGLPLVPLGRFIANMMSMTEGGHVAIGISMYVVNGWLLAYWTSVGILKAWQKAHVAGRGGQ
jgi:hypothetical protein